MAGCAVVVVTTASGRARVVRLWPLLLAATATLPFFLATRAIRGGETRWQTPWRAVVDAWASSGDLHDGAGDSVAWWAAAGCALLIVCAAVWRRERKAGDKPPPYIFAGLMVLAAYLFGPVVLPQVSVVAPRLLGSALGLLAGALPAPRGRLLVVIALVMSAAFTWHIVDVTRTYRAFSSEEMGDFEALLSAIPQRARVATHFTTTSSRHARHNALWHWPKLHCLRGAGFTDDLFAYRATAYVVVRTDAAGFVTPPHRLKPDALARFDAVLVRGAAAPPAPFTLSSTSGSWRLYLR
jgi:hypothetical protein